LGGLIAWVGYIIKGGGLASFVRCIVYSKSKVRKKKLTPKFDFLLKHSRRRKVTSTILWVKVGIF
jgi:hypothetical protein